MNYQWYPGHMRRRPADRCRKTKLIGLMIELVDASSAASRNPDMMNLERTKHG